MTTRGALSVTALSSTAMLASFLQTIMTPLVPDLPVILHTDAASASWVLTAALLAACATAPLTSRLGDVVGRRRMLVALLGVIIVGSVVGALSTTLGGIIVARSLQGIGLGVMALNVSVLRDVVSPARLPVAIVAVSASNGVGGSLGLPLSAVVSQYLDWHALFWLAAGLAAASAAAVLLVVPRAHRPPSTSVDWIGAVALAAGLTAVVLAISQSPVWFPLVTCGLGVAGVTIIALWVRHELRTRVPLIDVRLVFRGPTLIVNLVGVTSGFCWFAIPGLVARLLQSTDGAASGFGLDMVTASLVIMPTGLSMLFFAPFAQRIVRRYGARIAIVVGSSLSAAGYLTGLLWMDVAWHLAIVSSLVGIGSVLVFSSAALVIVTSVPAAVSASANGVNSVMRWMGSMLSSAIIGAILASFAFTFDGTPVPTAEGYRLAFILALGAGMAGAILALFLPRRARETAG